MAIIARCYLEIGTGLADITVGRKVIGEFTRQAVIFGGAYTSFARGVAVVTHRIIPSHVVALIASVTSRCNVMRVKRFTTALQTRTICICSSIAGMAVRFTRFTGETICIITILPKAVQTNVAYRCSLENVGNRTS